jgi:hypothetical protein
MPTTRTTVLASAVVALGVMGPILAAQGRPNQPPSAPTPPHPISTTNVASSKTETITVEGCLQGTSLEPTAEDVILSTYNANEYDLSVPKSLRETLKAHEGHLERITGALSLPPDEDRMAATKQLGAKTHLAVSQGDASPYQIGKPSIAVSKIVHLADKCSVLGKRDPSPARTGTATIGGAK